MATVNLGSIKFKWKGTYAGGTAYTIDDVVSYNGSSYICILASTGNLPTNATYFEQMSQAGTNGTDLTTTLTTQGDILYRDGSGLVRLGAGTAGQVLQTGGAGANPSWVNQDRINMNVSGVAGDYHNAKIELFRPKFVSAGERNRNTILIESVSCQNPGSSINVENITTFACIHEGNANKNNDIDYVRFEYNGSTFDIKWAVYGRKW
jgi:hypothetical protein